MKKLFILTIATITGLSAFAQKPAQQDPLEVSPKESVVNPQSEIQPYFEEGEKGTTPAGGGKAYERYFNIFSALDSLFIANPNQQGTAFINVHYDSLTTIFQDGSTGSVFRHSMGMVFDPGARKFTQLHGQDKAITSETSWTLDSIRFPYTYNRPKDSAFFHDVQTKMDTAYDFTVNGQEVDSILVKRDTTYRITSNDSIPLDQFEIVTYDNNFPPNPKDTFYRFPPITIDETATPTDTTLLTVDSTWKNNSTPFSYEDTVGQVKKQVVDTLFIQIYREVLGDGQPSSMLNFRYEATAGDSVGIAYTPIEVDGIGNTRSQRRGLLPLTEKEILLTKEDTAESVVRVFSEFVGLSDNSGNDQNTIMAATLTFKPGYNYKPTDTLFDASGSEVEYKNNAFSIFRYLDESGEALRGYNNSLYLSTTQIYYPDTFQNFFRNNYLVSPFPSGNPVNQQIFYNMDFHITANNVGESVGINDANSGALKISSVYPNPATINDEVNMTINLDKAERVDLSLYNSIGQSVKDLGSQRMTKGEHTINMSTANLEPGIYFIRINTPDREKTVKVSISE